MYSSLSIKNFRGIGEEPLKMDNLRRINLIVGTNGSGKTTVLESLFLLGSATNPAPSFIVGNLRGHWTQSADSAWRPLFHGADPQCPINISATCEGSERNLEIGANAADPLANFATPLVAHNGTTIKASETATPLADSPIQRPAVSTTVSNTFTIGSIQYKLRMGKGQEVVRSVNFNPANQSFSSTPPQATNEEIIPTGFLASGGPLNMSGIAREFSSLVRDKQEKDSIQALQVIEPRLVKVNMLTVDGMPALYMDVGLGSLLPLAVAGGGTVWFFAMAMSLTGVRDGVLLIDEIDNGLHHSVMEQVWRFLAKQAKDFNVQIFATTHNDEMIRSALNSLQDEAEHPGLFRLDMVKGKPQVACYDDEAQQAVLKFGFEVRA